MSVVNGQNADAATFNSAFASKSQDNTLQGIQTLAHAGSGATVTDTQQAINDVIASDALKIPTAQKGVANGVATLDATTKIPVAQVPDLTASKITDFNIAADARITAQKGFPSGLAPLDASSKIDSAYLPSYVDDVVEVANYAALPVTGETGKIYVTLDTNKTYRWSGSVYVQIGQPIASTSDVPEGTNLYFTPARVADKQIGIQFQDQGSNLGTTATVDTIDFIGAGITATRASNKVTVEVTATGSGGGSKNYFSQSSINPDFETGSVSPWQVMTTTWSGNAPINAPTPGAVVTTFYTNIVSPLAGTTSAMMTKGGGVGQYEGVMSGIFTVDREDQSKVLFGSFAYETVMTASANFDVSGTSSQTVEIWVYNVNANQWIQPAGFRGINQFVGPGQVTFSFQTDSLDANNQYRICLIIRQNTAGAWNLKVDDFKVGPQAIVLGTPITDWKSYTPSVTYASGSATNVVHHGRYRRVGDSIEIEVSSVWSAASAAFTRPIYSLPSGLTVDTSKNTASVQGAITDEVVGFSRANDTVNNAYPGSAALYSTTQFFPHLINASTTYGSFQDFTSTIPFTIGANDSITTIVRLPIVGWSSNVQTSSDTDTKIVAGVFSKNATQSIATASITKVLYQTVSKDTAGAWDSVNNRYYIPISGFYSVSVVQQYASGVQDARIAVVINGVLDKYIGRLNIAAGAADLNGTGVIYCNAGDYVEIHTFQNSGAAVNLTATSSSNHFEIYRLSGPSIITATETVACRYSTATTTINSSGNLVVFSTKDYDTHGFYNNSTGVITIPVSGKYIIKCITETVSASATVLTNGTYLMLFKGSTPAMNTMLGNFRFPFTGTATPVIQNGTTTIQANAGDLFYIYLGKDPGVNNYSLSGTNYGNVLTIERVGN